MATDSWAKQMTKEQIRKLCVEAAQVDREATIDIILNSGSTLSPADIEELEDIAARPDNDRTSWDPWTTGDIRRD